MIVHIPSPLRSYTANKSEVEAQGATLGEVLHDLEARYPGIRFRMIDEQGCVRPHIKIFVNKSLAQNLAVGVTTECEVHIIAALSGG